MMIMAQCMMRSENASNDLESVKMKPSNMSKKKTPNVTKLRLNVILELPNVVIKPSNMRKNKGTTKEKVTS